jgi:hypothetical protein
MENEPATDAMHHFSLAERPQIAIDLYCHLYEETKIKAFKDASLALSPDPSSSIFFFYQCTRLPVLRSQSFDREIARLGVGWWLYAGLHRRIVERSPLMELERYLENISYSHALASWSDDVNQLAEWIDNGATGQPPLDDRNGVMTRRVISRMREIRIATKGWVYGYLGGN